MRLCCCSNNLQLEDILYKAFPKQAIKAFVLQSKFLVWLAWYSTCVVFGLMPKLSAEIPQNVHHRNREAAAVCHPLLYRLYNFALMAPDKRSGAFQASVSSSN